MWDCRPSPITEDSKVLRVKKRTVMLLNHPFMGLRRVETYWKLEVQYCLLCTCYHSPCVLWIDWKKNMLVAVLTVSLPCRNGRYKLEVVICLCYWTSSHPILNILPSPGNRTWTDNPSLRSGSGEWFYVEEEFMLKLIILSYLKETISAALFFLSMAAQFLKYLF